MQQLLKQSTAATTIVGPVLDSTGASYTGLVISDLNITKNGATAAMAAAATLTHDHNGHYLLLFTTGNTDTLGRLDITCNKATYAMPPKVFEVLSATVFDAIVTNGTLASSTSGRTIAVDANGVADSRLADAVSHGGTLGSSTATLALSRINVTSQTGNTVAVTVAGNGTGAGASFTGGATGAAVTITGGATSGNGITVTTTSGDGISSVATGAGKHGLVLTGGAAVTTSAAGEGLHITGGTASTGAGGVAGAGLRITGGAGAASVNGAASGMISVGGGTNTVASVASGVEFTGTSTGHGVLAGSGSGATGDGIQATAFSTDGVGMSLLGRGNGDGMRATGGSSAGGDGIQATAGGGVPIRGNITGDITGNLSGSVGSVSGAVGSVTATVTANVSSINSVSTSSVTTVNANIGQTQPVNFTGTGASALVKSDMVDIAGAAVSTSTAQVGVNVVNYGGSAGTFAGGRPEVNVSHWKGTAAATVDTAGYPVVTIKDGTGQGEIALTAGAVDSVTAVASITGGVTVTTNNDKTGYSLAAAGLDAVTVESGLNARQSLSIMSSALAGVLSGAATTTVTILGAGVATTRVVATVDASGNRSALTLTPPA